MESKARAADLTEESISSLRSSLHRVKQILTLLYTPPSQSNLPSVGTQNGLLYSLHDLLHPLNDVFEMQGKNEKAISSTLAPASQRMATSSSARDVFMQNATTITQLTNQVSSSLKEPIITIPQNVTALHVLEQWIKNNPLHPKDQKEVLLRLRKKRRLILPDISPSKSVNVDSPTQHVRSPLHPIPSQLTFDATTSWVDDLVERTSTYSSKDTCTTTVEAFNMYMDKRCQDESLIFKNSQGDRYLPKQRVRARLAYWNDSCSEIDVELRDVGCVNIKFTWSDAKIQIIHVGVTSPSEYAQDGTHVLLPSKYGFHNDLSTHLFTKALHYQRKESQPIAFLCTTLMHVASLRTLYDPIPAPPTPVSTSLSRTAYGSLDQSGFEEYPSPVSWKWCRTACDSPTAAAQGEWVAFSPLML